MRKNYFTSFEKFKLQKSRYKFIHLQGKFKIQKKLYYNIR